MQKRIVDSGRSLSGSRRRFGNKDTSSEACLCGRCIKLLHTFSSCIWGSQKHRCATIEGQPEQGEVRRALWVLSWRVSHVVLRLVTNAGTVSHAPHSWSSVAIGKSEGGPSDRQPHSMGVKPPSCTSTSCHGRCTLQRPLDAGLSRSRDMLSPHRS